MRLRYLGVFLSLALFLLSACGRGEDTTVITLSGSSTVAPLALEIAKRFEESHAGVRIDVQTGGSGRGIADTRNGIVDIGMASRALKGDETSLHAFTIARDGIAIIVHADNPLSALTREDVIGIYTGRIANWSAVGGPDRPIVVINKAEGRATLDLFLEHFGIKNSDIAADTIVGDNEQGVKTVAGNRDAIGYVSIGTAEYDIGAGIPIKMLTLNGAVPSLAAVRAGTYPISRPLNLLTRDEPQGIVREFIDYARSEQVHDLVRSLYFVPVEF